MGPDEGWGGVGWGGAIDVCEVRGAAAAEDVTRNFSLTTTSDTVNVIRRSLISILELHLPTSYGNLKFVMIIKLHAQEHMLRNTSFYPPSCCVLR